MPRQGVRRGGQHPPARCARGCDFRLGGDTRGASRTSMFQSLSDRLSGVLDKLTRRGALTESDVGERCARCAARCSRPTSRSSRQGLRRAGQGEGRRRRKCCARSRPGQMVVKIVHDELVEMLGSDAAPIDLNAAPPVGIMMVGLQGSGKTTTTAKIAKRLTEPRQQEGADGVARHAPPGRAGAAARARRADRASTRFRSSPGQTPSQIARRALRCGQARRLRRRACSTPPAASTSTKS